MSSRGFRMWWGLWMSLLSTAFLVDVIVNDGPWWLTFVVGFFLSLGCRLTASAVCMSERRP